MGATLSKNRTYYLFRRERVEDEYRDLYSDMGLGLTTWSPLASGLLTGKYLDGIPAGSRAELLDFVAERARDEETQNRVRRFIEIAESLDCTPAQLAIAWCATNPDVSTVITGASRVEQVRENLGALEVMGRLDEETRNRIAELFA